MPPDQIQAIGNLEKCCSIRFVTVRDPDTSSSLFEASILDEISRRKDCFLLSNSDFPYARKEGLIDGILLCLPMLGEHGRASAMEEEQR